MANIKDREREFRRRLEKEGLVIPTKRARLRKQKRFKPVKVHGKPLSQMIIEDRR